mmetsp:Transcript_9480/g.28862  ORF Transcript_9480/g.28862 Transcript_9480/m.28862 type:complete len:208 (-) Transcript_9480:679-1302(-)
MTWFPVYALFMRLASFTATSSSKTSSFPRRAHVPSSSAILGCPLSTPASLIATSCTLFSVPSAVRKATRHQKCSQSTPSMKAFLSTSGPWVCVYSPCARASFPSRRRPRKTGDSVVSWPHKLKAFLAAWPSLASTISSVISRLSSSTCWMECCKWSPRAGRRSKPSLSTAGLTAWLWLPMATSVAPFWTRHSSPRSPCAPLTRTSST